MNLINRDFDPITMQHDLELLHSFPNFPVFMGCSSKDESSDLMADMNWFISKSSGLIQLNPLIPANVLYKNQHGSGCVGAIWLQHHQAFAEFVEKFSPNNILEIGGGHGILSREFKKIPHASWVILEPNPDPAEGVDARYIKGFFDENFSLEDPVDAIVHSHVFEHIYYPDQFIKNLGKFLTTGKRLIFSIPNMKVMLNRKYNNCLNFEHTIFLTEPYVEYLLGKYGFELVEKKYFLDDHSIFYSYQKIDSFILKALPPNLYQINKEIFLNYITHYKNLVDTINSKLDLVGKRKEIFIFGAHIFTQYLIEFGLNVSKITGILDNDKNKQGKRLYGTKLMVFSPEVLKNFDLPFVILKAGAYSSEIKDQILKQINHNTLFLE
ncbi:class I SAM-dependent methyltransferase [Polynucleobacter sp. MWH-UH24A]|uniref:class I SAM-dependent methyltransferase n=1 Tax=Polynucleobacter sp. MWH-UH24A TaxID=2689110 RepID=UPI001BFD8893|nr:class I SAM-dependent methyltransferase [Polynucleobacter sp. MWH-UH24A]QWD76405.1 class I SAM-dependent methyltransferase [Polynucleobacter sp. MWH-UH24A]